MIKDVLVYLDQRIGKVVGEPPQRETGGGQCEGNQKAPRDDLGFFDRRSFDTRFLARRIALDGFYRRHSVTPIIALMTPESGAIQLSKTLGTSSKEA